MRRDRRIPSSFSSIPSVVHVVFLVLLVHSLPACSDGDHSKLDSGADTDTDTDTCDEIDVGFPDLDAGIFCEGACLGDCFIVEADQAACWGEDVVNCDGSCGGTCLGGCSTGFLAPFYSDCSAECLGICTGICNGTCTVPACWSQMSDGDACPGYCFGDCAE